MSTNDRHTTINRHRHNPTIRTRRRQQPHHRTLKRHIQRRTRRHRRRDEPPERCDDDDTHHPRREHQPRISVLKPLQHWRRGGRRRHDIRQRRLQISRVNSGDREVVRLVVHQSSHHESRICDHRGDQQLAVHEHPIRHRISNRIPRELHLSITRRRHQTRRCCRRGRRRRRAHHDRRHGAGTSNVDGLHAR